MGLILRKYALEEPTLNNDGKDVPSEEGAAIMRRVDGGEGRRATSCKLVFL